MRRTTRRGAAAPRQTVWDGFSRATGFSTALAPGAVQITGPFGGPWGVDPNSVPAPQYYLQDPTLRRIRGTWAFHTTAADSAGDHIHAAIGIIKWNLGNSGTLTAADLAFPLTNPEDDWIVHQRATGMAPSGAAMLFNVGGGAGEGSMMIDSKAQRKFVEGDVLYVAVQNSSVSTLDLYYTWSIRCLWSGARRK